MKKLPNEQLEFHRKTRVEIYTTLLNLLKQNILNRDIRERAT